MGPHHEKISKKNEKSEQNRSKKVHNAGGTEILQLWVFCYMPLNRQSVGDGCLVIVVVLDEADFSAVVNIGFSLRFSFKGP